MKAPLFVVWFVCFTLSTYASNYYFSSVSGNDSRSAAEAQNPATPWKSLAKLNAFFASLKPGDGVYLKRDETFYGSLIIKQSGSTTAPITIGAYGSGSKPIITSLVTLTDWVSKGNGIWESYNALLGGEVNIVLLNGVQQEMGRYPNSNAVNRGYLNFESHSGKTSITDNELSSAINWKGAELVTRPRHWILNRSLITAHSGKTISYTTNSIYEPYENYGYFIQKSIKTLDRVGEWYYDASTKKLSMYFGAGNPSNVQASTTTSDLVSSSKFSNLIFDNLSVKGSNASGFFINSGSNITIQNCDILFSGLTGAIVHGHTNFHLENSTISNSNTNGLDMEYSVVNAVIKNNKILNTALFPGLLLNGDGTGLAIYSNGEGATIESNEILETGFIGITFYGSNVVIKNNLIDHFCFVKDDGGALYSHGGATISTNRKLLNNIITNGTGAGPGTDRPTKVSVNGIYMDADVVNVEITGNTVVNCYHGLFLQSTQGTVVKSNTFYDNSNQMSILRRPERNVPKNNNLTQNICFSKTKDQQSFYAVSNANDISSFGKFDYNYYVRPVDDKLTIFTSYVSGGKTVNADIDLATWQNRYNQDPNSKKSPITLENTTTTINQSINFQYNATNVSKTIPLNGDFIDVTGKKYTGSTVLQPFTSIVLIKTGGGVVNVAPTVNITSPANNQDFTAPASFDITAIANDQDGTVSKVDFYNGNTLLGSDNTSPYSFNWSNAGAGNYILTAKATDNVGTVTTSDPVTISVTEISNGAPSVSISSPADNAQFAEGATIDIAAIASDNGSIVSVDFYNGATLLGSDNTSPYSFTWANVAAGNYVLTAVATDDEGLSSTSGGVSVSVAPPGPLPPVVSITSPVNNATYTEPATITVSASATYDNGGVKKVEFFSGSTLLKTESTAPYTFNWQNVAAGNYSLTAVATGNDGVTSTSSAVSISVNGANAGPVVNMTSPTSTNYTSPATITMSATATDANGSVSRVEFFNGSTLLSSQTSAPYSFTWQDVPAGTYSLTAVATDNDDLTTTSAAIVVTVSGAQMPPVVNMTAPTVTTYTAPATITMTATASDPNGSVTKVEFFNGTTLLNTQKSSPYSFVWQNVPAGNYTLTAVATDNSGLKTTSSGIPVVVNSTGPVNKSPTVKITSPAGSDTTYPVAPANINLAATASDADGSIVKVEFFNGSVLLKTESTMPYTCNWKPGAGTYNVTARATDNKGSVTTSSIVRITVGSPVARSSSSKAPSVEPAAAVAAVNSQSTVVTNGGSKGKFFSREEPNKLRDLRVFPDPAVSTMELRFNGLQTYQKAMLTIHDMQGALISKRPVIISGQKIEVNVTSLSAGIYIIGLSADHFTINRKFAKIN